MRFIAQSVVCPRCGNESPPTGMGRFMTCAKCGMSIDAGAGERQEAVRGRVKEKPEIEIDPTLPPRPSTFPLGLAIAGAILVTGGIAFVAYEMSRDRDDLTDEQRENVRVVKAKQRAFADLWSSMRSSHDDPKCQELFTLVQRTCKPTVEASLLDFDGPARALGSLSPLACTVAVELFSMSRVEASCD